MNEVALSFYRKINKGKLAIIDIGSNSIRLVIYPQNGKYPFPLFNERVNCKLGEGLSLSKNISSQSISKALSAIKRFAYIIKTMSVKHQLIIATAAVRKAKNAKEFLRPAEKLLNHNIKILSAKEEADYASLGVLSNIKVDKGLIADLGGGSLELILIQDGKKIKSTSIDIGHLSQITSEEIRKEIKADFILTAHHADDQVETILMKIMNSSGLDGLQGLRKLRQNIIRPMYNISKSEISDYASLNNVKYIDDPTNSDNTFTRNFLRMNVIPELKKIKNDIHIPFNNFTDRIDEVHDLIAFNVQNFCNSDSYRVNDNNIEINKSDFYNLPFLVQLKIISNQCIDTKNSFSKTDVREIKDLLRKNLTGSSKTVNDKTILIDRNSLVIYKNMKNDIFINVEAGKEFKGKDFTFSWDFNKAPKTFNNDNEIEFIDASKITDKLVIRSVRDNDSFLPLGMSGNKKVAKFLKDKKKNLKLYF